MKRNLWRLAPFFMVILFLAGPVVAAADLDATSQAAAAPREEEEEAMSILERSADYLSKAQSFTVTVDTGYDVVQPSGQKVEFGEIRQYTIQRPNRSRVDVVNRDGTEAGFVFDGRDISVFNARDNVYAVVSRPGTVDAAFDYFVDDLNMRMPLAELFSSDLPETLKDFRDAEYVETAVIGGIPCDHVAARGDDVDVQVWITRGDQPLLQRLVVTYKNEVGQPQFWADFMDWNLSPALDDSLFAFTPPPGAERISFVAQAAGELEAGEKPNGESQGETMERNGVDQ